MIENPENHIVSNGRNFIDRIGIDIIIAVVFFLFGLLINYVSSDSKPEAKCEVKYEDMIFRCFEKLEDCLDARKFDIGNMDKQNFEEREIERKNKIEIDRINSSIKQGTYYPDG